jgi:1-acyl-sn-glycerol-3-phosphate acyltransferase
MIRRLIARAFWTFSKWRLVTEPAPQRPTVFLGAPHTSNWDFVLMLSIAWSLRIKVLWLGKDSLFTGWRGPIMRGLGGIPVDRSDPSRIVAEVVDRIRAGEVFGLVITPDGTRGGHTHWKSGFHRIAVKTGMPVTLGYLDAPTRTTGLGPTVEMTANITEDMDRNREFYVDKRGIRPHLQITPRLREEDSDDREGDPEPS